MDGEEDWKIPIESEIVNVRECQLNTTNRTMIKVFQIAG